MYLFLPKTVDLVINVIKAMNLHFRQSFGVKIFPFACGPITSLILCICDKNNISKAFFKGLGKLGTGDALTVFPQG